MRLFGLVVGLTTIALPATGKDEISDSVVKFEVTQRFPSFTRPWTKGSPQKTAGTGVVIEGNRILTNAHVVQYADQIFVQPNQSTEKLPGRVLAISHGMDLAVVAVDEPSFFAERKPVPLAEGIPHLRDKVNCYGYPIGGAQQSVTEGIISRIEFVTFYCLADGLRIQVDAALNPGNSGGPAISDGKIVGLVFSTLSGAENIGYLVAADEIATFLEDIKDGAYAGKPRMFDALQSAENEALRARLGLEKGGGGVMVNQPYQQPDNPLRRWDVITHIGDHPIDTEGNVQVRDDLWLGFRYYTAKLAKDGRVPLKIVRDKKPIDVQMPVRPDCSLLLPFLKGAYPSHFVLGPMVFTNVTQELAAQLPAAALVATDNPIVTQRSDTPAFEGEQVVALGPRLFPHEISKGYGNDSYAVVEEVDDTKVKNLRHLVELLRGATGEFVTIKLAGKYETLVFRRQGLLASTERILENEGIRNQYSADLRDVWEK
jgi:S1-C subfamily serine protease